MTHDAFNMDLMDAGLRDNDYPKQLFARLFRNETFRQQRPISVAAAMGLVDSYHVKKVGDSPGGQSTSTSVGSSFGSNSRVLTLRLPLLSCYMHSWPVHA